MTSIAAAMKREPSPYTAAAFLLSADPTLWKKSRQAIRGGGVDFGKIDVRGVGPDGYALLQTAKDLYHGGCRVTTDERGDVPRELRDEARTEKPSRKPSPKPIPWQSR